MALEGDPMTGDVSPGGFSPRVDEALALAGRLHARQRRKGSGAPYVTHLWAVAATVAEAGGDEDEVIAALLHDAVEDQGGAAALQLIEEKFGARVAEIVRACSDTDQVPKPPWRERKEAFLQRLATADPPVVRVTLADKLHNVASLCRQLEAEGPRTWERFRGGPAGTVWYYRRIAEILASRGPAPFIRELTERVAKLESLARPGSFGSVEEHPSA